MCPPPPPAQPNPNQPNPSPPRARSCALCVFPAAAVAVHVAFSLAFLVALWVTSSRLAAAVLNRRLKRRMRFFQWAQTLLVATGGNRGGIPPWTELHPDCIPCYPVRGQLIGAQLPCFLPPAPAGAGAIGGSIGQTPFGWVYEGCWIGYLATVVAGVVLVVWEVVMWPARDLSRMNKVGAGWVPGWWVLDVEVNWCAREVGADWWVLDVGTGCRWGLEVGWALKVGARWRRARTAGGGNGGMMG